MAKKVFDGLKIADFSWFIVGPWTGKYFADFGATVVRIESTAHIDRLRQLAPYQDGIRGVNRSGYWNEFNSSKYSITLDTKKPLGRDIARKMALWADIVIEAYTPGVMPRLGLGYEDLKKIKPDIIMISSSSRGQYGPFAQTPAFGHVAQYIAGFGHMTGWPDREPVGAYGPYTDFVTPWMVVTATIAALDYRRRTGKGQYIDAAAVESSIHALETAVLDYTVNGREQTRAGNRLPYAAPHGAFPCQGEERWCVIAVFTDEEWANLCRVIDEPWVREDRFATMAGRKRHEGELEQLLGQWTMNYSAEEVMVRLQDAAVPAGVVQNAKDMHEDAQLKHRDHFWHLDHAENGRSAFSSPPIRLSKTACEVKPSPLLGEHNEYVLKEFLGMSDEEIVEAAIGGVLQ